MAGLNGFQIRDKKVTHMNVEVNPDFEAEQYRLDFKMHNTIKHCKASDDGQKTAKITCSIELKASCVGDEDNIYALIHVTDVGVFSVNADTSEEDFEKMLRINGMVTILPIVRGIIFNAANNLGIRAPMLVPNVNVTKMSWDK